MSEETSIRKQLVSDFIFLKNGRNKNWVTKRKFELIYYQ